MSKEKIKVVIYDGEQYGSDFPGWDSKLTYVISWLQKFLDKIPEEYRANARCEIDSVMSYDQSLARIRVSYDRPETKEEARERRAQEAAGSDNQAARERAELARLKSKYESA